MIATREMISRIAQQSTIDATKETHRWMRWKLSWGEAFFSLKDATALVMVRPLLVLERWIWSGPSWYWTATTDMPQEGIDCSQHSGSVDGSQAH